MLVFRAWRNFTKAMLYYIVTLGLFSRMAIGANSLKYGEFPSLKYLSYIYVFVFHVKLAAYKVNVLLKKENPAIFVLV